MERLAFIGDATVVAAFARWHDDPPPAWPTEFVELMLTAPMEAGWELTPEAGRRLLYRPACAILRPGPGRSTTADGSRTTGGAGVMNAHVQHCPWCGTPLVHILDLPAADPQLAFLGLPGEGLSVPTCLYCGCFATIYTDVDHTGSATWSFATDRPNYLRLEDNELPAWLYGGTYEIEALRAPFEHALFGDSFPHVGGLPKWIQGEGYPSCPRCQRRMPFLGQIPLGAVGGDEGDFYVFYDADCSMAATNYQQT